LDYLKAAFNPRGVAVVGASNSIQKFGAIFTDSLKSAHFAYIYPVNPKKREIMGLQAYPSLKDISGPCDYAIISVSAEKIPNVIQDCAVKRVKTVSIFTAGFSESGDKEGRRKEKELVEVAHSGNIRVIGPNCLGTFCPEVGLTPFPVSGGNGEFGFISQSGGHMEELCRLGKKYGIGMSKGVSYGNACDLDSTDFIEYLEEDPNTKVIGVYIEGVKEGSRFLKVVRKASSKSQS
jgi:acetyltransferase